MTKVHLSTAVLQYQKITITAGGAYVVDKWQLIHQVAQSVIAAMRFEKLANLETAKPLLSKGRVNLVVSVFRKCCESAPTSVCVCNGTQDARLPRIHQSFQEAMKGIKRILASIKRRFSSLKGPTWHPAFYTKTVINVSILNVSIYELENDM